MAHSRKATTTEKQIIRRLVHAFIISEIGREVIANDSQEHAERYREHMREKFPHWFRLLDEFQATVPSVRKQLLAEFEKDMKKNP